jgi:hypothetical protein
MRWRTRPGFVLIAAALVVLGLSDSLYAQATGPLASPTGLGSLAMSPGQLMGAGSPAQQPVSDAIAINDSFVSFIEGAAPRSLFMMRLEAGYGMRQPTRAEYFLSKGGLPNSPGYPLIETKVDYQEWDSYAEYALTPWFSMFIQAPYRWLNPNVNQNESGGANMQYGMKLCTWSSAPAIATFEVRLYQPAAHTDIAFDHWAVEPGLLAAYRWNDNILLEGDIHYWIPIRGTDFSGEVLRYGIGLSYGKRQPNGFWFMPVVEAVGWTVMNGKTILANSPDSYLIQDARGQTIINGYLGLRWGYGNLDFYTGYGRSFTGDAWQRDTIRLEARFVY